MGGAAPALRGARGRLGERAAHDAEQFTLGERLVQHRHPAVPRVAECAVLVREREEARRGVAVDHENRDHSRGSAVRRPASSRALPGVLMAATIMWLRGYHAGKTAV